jgi:Domain of unknown function (DUF4483)
MRGPSGASESLNKSLMLPDEYHAYGKALRPSTPIRMVVNNVYGDFAEQDMYNRYTALRFDY